jgi:hypothetical protein
MNGWSLRHEREEILGLAVYKWKSTVGWAAMPISLVEYVKAGCRNRANTDGRYDCTRKWRGKQHARESRGLRDHGKVAVESHTGASSLAYLLIVDPGWLKAISDASQRPGHRAMDLCA